jgi:hypothetical protein
VGSSLEMSLSPNCPNLQIRSAPCMPTNRKATYDLGKKESPILSVQKSDTYMALTQARNNTNRMNNPHAFTLVNIL